MHTMLHGQPPIHPLPNLSLVLDGVLRCISYVCPAADIDYVWVLAGHTASSSVLDLILLRLQSLVGMS